MKKINKNKRNSFLLKGFTFLILTFSFQSMIAQDDPLVIEGETVKIKKLEVMDLTVKNPSTFWGMFTAKYPASFENGLSTTNNTSKFNGPLTTTNTTTFEKGFTSKEPATFDKGFTAATSVTFEKGFNSKEPATFDQGIKVGFATSTFKNKVIIGDKVEGNEATLHVTGDLRVTEKVSIGAPQPFEVDAVDFTGGRFVITESGNVGIGYQKPKAPLVVKAIIGNYAHLNKVLGMSIEPYKWIYTETNFLKSYPNRSVSITTDGDIISATAIYVASDVRLKKNIQTSISLADLELLKAIEIVNYKKIDTIADNRKFKKVIAQQVKEVYPLAVQQSTQDFIPSVFQASASIDKLGTNEYGLTVTNPHNLAVEDIVELKCYPGNKSEQVTVSKIISPTKFEVQSTNELDTLEYVFVYGKQVDELLSVDYDAISMLNVSATQELAEQVEALQSENKSLIKRIAILEKQTEDIEGLKASLATLLTQKEIADVSSIEKVKK